MPRKPQYIETLSKRKTVSKTRLKALLKKCLTYAVELNCEVSLVVKHPPENRCADIVFSSSGQAEALAARSDCCRPRLETGLSVLQAYWPEQQQDSSTAASSSFNSMPLELPDFGFDVNTIQC
jgi:hypothetical protein